MQEAGDLTLKQSHVPLVHHFTFNPFQENTYLVYEPHGDCLIIDPGCWDRNEQAELRNFIDEHRLNPSRLLNTHCHIDHILGNNFVANTWSLPLETHEIEVRVLQWAPKSLELFGLPYADPSPEPERFLKPGDTVGIGNVELEMIFVPGHSPGHLAFVNHQDRWVIGGDVLFRESIGRTDLPEGDFGVLERSIQEQMYVLPDDYTVYPGHGPSTTIGHEKKHNPFVKHTP